MTSSASAARPLAASAKQVERSAHRRPAQRSAPTATSAQSASDGSNGSSARSPVSVVLDPGLELLPGRLVARVAQEHRAEALQLLPAEVVLTPLEDGDAHLPAERSRRRRHVFREELLLEGLGRGSDHDRPARLEGGQQVGKALARSGARLGEEVLARGESTLDRGRERSLLGPGLEAGQRGGERAARGKCLVHDAVRVRMRTAVPPAAFPHKKSAPASPRTHRS